MLLIMGAFAAMAQNQYGLVILGLVAGSFSVLFLFQLMELYAGVTKMPRQFMLSGELISLIILSAVLCMRIFYVRFPLVEELYGVSGVVLGCIYVIKVVGDLKDKHFEKSAYRFMMIMIHSSIVMYITSMILVPFFPRYSEPFGIAGFILFIGFFVIAIVVRQIINNDENIPIIQYLTRIKDRSIVLIAIFMIFTAYMGLTKIGLVPKMYTDEYPKAYFELVNRAESSNEKSVNGEYKHEEFKEMYDKFINRHTVSE